MSYTGTSKKGGARLDLRGIVRGRLHAPAVAVREGFSDAAASQELVPHVEDDALPRRDRPLGDAKLDRHDVGTATGVDHRRGLVPVGADPNLRLERAAGRW